MSTKIETIFHLIPLYPPSAKRMLLIVVALWCSSMCLFTVELYWRGQPCWKWFISTGWFSLGIFGSICAEKASLFSCYVLIRGVWVIGVACHWSSHRCPADVLSHMNSVLLSCFWLPLCFFFRLLNICYNFALRATGWMSGHKRKKKKKQEQPRNVIQPASQRGQGRRSAEGPQVFEVRLDSCGPWTLPGTALRNLITFHYFDGKIRQTVHLRFLLALLTSCQSMGEPHNSARSHTHTGTYTHTNTHSPE